MNIDALSLTLVLVVLIVATNVILSYLRFPNVMEEADYRQSLQAVIKTLRLNKMLALLNIPLKQYLATVPINEIHQQVAACRACTELTACDHCLQKGVVEQNMSFCPNHQSLMQQRAVLNRLQ